MWCQGAAIRPVPAYAVIDAHIIADVETELAEHDEDSLHVAFEQFEAVQPALAERIHAVLSKPLDETALALGYFLSIAIFLAFEKQFGSQLITVDRLALRATEDALELEEQIRKTRTGEPLEVEDVVASQQPALVAFVHRHVEAALVPEGADVDVDDVDRVYKLILIELLSLSHAVKAVTGAPTKELLA